MKASVKVSIPSLIEGNTCSAISKKTLPKGSKNLSKIWGIIYVKRMIPMIHNYTSNISREQFELIREDLEN
ncbi:hypothetical protein Q0N88_16520, partial [Bacillus thuringiensis]|uniref:hypothetical protein n=1 Tax=Bacillus thuringiensis TaxID=1428 RepID=UPI0034596225